MKNILSSDRAGAGPCSRLAMRQGCTLLRGPAFCLYLPLLFLFTPQKDLEKTWKTPQKMEPPKDGAAEDGNSLSLPTPATESCPASFPATPPSFLSTLDPAHLGLPEHLASVTVPIRLDTLSYLLHSALLGTYNLQQSLPPCSCSTQPYHLQSDTGRRPPRGRGRGRGYGSWEGQRKPPWGQSLPRWGPGRGQQLERDMVRSPGAGPKTPPVTPPTQDGQKGAKGLGPSVSKQTVSEDWETDY